MKRLFMLMFLAFCLNGSSLISTAGTIHPTTPTILAPIITPTPTVSTTDELCTVNGPTPYGEIFDLYGQLPSGVATSLVIEPTSNHMWFYLRADLTKLRADGYQKVTLYDNGRWWDLEEEAIRQDGHVWLFFARQVKDSPKPQIFLDGQLQNSYLDPINPGRWYDCHETQLSPDLSMTQMIAGQWRMQYLPGMSPAKIWAFGQKAYGTDEHVVNWSLHYFGKDPDTQTDLYWAWFDVPFLSGN